MKRWKIEAASVVTYVKKNWFVFLMVANIMLIGLFVGSYVNKVSNLIVLEFSGEDLETYTEGQSIAGLVNEDYESGWYDIIPDMFLVGLVQVIF